ncbi:MAG: phenylalanine--tRNA ligase subunit beta [Candidatus Binatia bacterium]
MKFTLNWLKELVDFSASANEIARVLTMAGLEVDSLVPWCPERGQREEDWLMEIAVTPNRGDCLGIMGVAREIAALTGAHLKAPSTTPHTNDSSLKRLVNVRIVNPRLCLRYSARVVEGLHVAVSPAWMRNRLDACGIRSVNNIVDITNYVMLETGQPLHAFDLDRLPTKQVVVRQANRPGNFITLDDIVRRLDPEDLLICDGETPIALAGVMGGRNSEVGPDTHAVLLESAHFDALSVRRTARRQGLHSEASHRFERGVDPTGTLYALNRAGFLLATTAGGIPSKGVIDAYPRPKRPASISVRYQRVKRLLGIELGVREIERIFKSLGLMIQSRSKSIVKVIPPAYRHDLSREADLIEELARCHGYDKIPAMLPLVRPEGKVDWRLKWERKIRSVLIGGGLTEVLNLPFTSEEMNRHFLGHGKDQALPVPIMNPLVQECSEMRLSLLPGLLANLRTHVEQKAKGFAGFELGKVFNLQVDGAKECPREEAKGSIEEKQCLAGILFGQRQHRGLGKGGAPFTFLDLKGSIERILEVTRVGCKISWVSSSDASFLHPGKSAALQRNGASLGMLGEVHPDLCHQWNLPTFLVFELDFDGLVHYARPDFAVRPLPRFPSVERDLAVVVDEAFPAQRIISWVTNLGQSLIEDVQVFDQYHGAPIAEGRKSLAYTISYRAEDRTLTDLEVNTLHQDLVAQIGEIFGAEPRGSKESPN